MRKLLRN